MKRIYFACLFQLLTTTFLLSQSNPVALINQSAKVVPPISASQADPKAQARILDNYGKLPLSFEANHGQTDKRVKFLSRTGGYTLFLTGDEAVLALGGKRENTKAKIVGAAHTMPPVAATKGGGVLRMKLRNANPAAKVSGMDELAGRSNYFIGNDPAKWRTNVPTYAKVKYEGIYSGIDLVYYGNHRQLEYDFIVAPGADPRCIAFDVRGAKRIRRGAQGDLVLKVGEGEIRWHKPVVYQEKNGTRQEITAHYAITDTNRVGFELAKYDASKPLYIDPLIYSTYLGGSGDDDGYGIAVDSSGSPYVTGRTASTNFPTMNPLQPVNAGGYDVFVAKINASGSALVYSTYLGGSGNDAGSGIAVDSADNAYVTGVTSSGDFPTTPGAFQTTLVGYGSAFVTEINPTGSALVYSTYLGGSSGDDGNGIAVDSSGDAYVTGLTYSTNFPVTPGAFQTTCGDPSSCGNAFVTKFNATGSALVYSTYLGGSGNGPYGDRGFGIAVDSSGNAYVTGRTASTNFPVTPGAFQTVCGSCYQNGYFVWVGNAFVTKFNPAGSALVYSTYLGGSQVLDCDCGDGDDGNGIAVDSSGDAYVTGGTISTNFPVTPSAFQTTLRGEYGNAFVTEINPTGWALVYSTYLGGSYYDEAYGTAVDSLGNAYVTGRTASTNFPVTPGAFQTTYGGGYNAFVTKLNTTGSALVYSTYLGGSSGDDEAYGTAVDSSGNAYVTGRTCSTDFPTRSPLQPAYGGSNTYCGDAFVAKINPTPSDVTLFPLHLNFVGQPMGIASSPQVSTLTNVSNATVNITSISVIGANSGDFAQTNNCGASVPQATSCSITVTFTPTAKGNRSAAVNITDSDPYSPQQLSLTGIGLLDTVTNLKSSANPLVLGKPVTFKATVSSPSGGTPTGSVSFMEGTMTLATKAIKGGTATFTTKKLPLGLNVITAFYGGDLNYGFSTSAPVNQYVVEAITATTLTSSSNPSSYGQPVTFTAEVTSKLGPPPDGETVSFVNGTTVMGTGTLSGGSASFTTSTLSAGYNLITAVYGGDLDFSSSTSKALKQIVETPAPYGVVTPTALNFGQVQVGQTSAPQLVSLENTGESKLIISSISLSGDFALPTNHCAAGVKPLTHCNVYITFTPQALGTETGTLTFVDNASNSPQTISLTGTGTN